MDPRSFPFSVATTLIRASRDQAVAACADSPTGRRGARPDRTKVETHGCRDPLRSEARIDFEPISRDDRYHFLRHEKVTARGSSSELAWKRTPSSPTFVTLRSNLFLPLV